MRLALAAPILALLASPCAALAASTALPTGSASLAAHHAVYTLTLDRLRGGDVVAASGAMTYRVIDACTGWAVSQRLALTILNRSGQTVNMLSDYDTWENKAGTALTFHMEQETGGAVTDEVNGSARLSRPGGPGTIDYTAPQAHEASLPAGTLFPMAHTARIIAEAERGHRFLAVPLFDGTGHDGAQDTFVSLLGWNGPKSGPYPALAALHSGRVHIAFFTRAPNTTTPDYEIGMRYYSNGVASGLKMDFGDFVMDGKLAKFQLAPKPADCRP